MADFVIAHMYPDLMDLYGDHGNLTCLQKRLEWYGHQCFIKDINQGNQTDYQAFDMLFMGNGSGREQVLVGEDLFRTAKGLKDSIENGMPVLFIGSAYQLLGKSYVDDSNEVTDGLGFFNFYTQGAAKRLNGDIITNSSITGEAISIVGFENHRGRTYLEDRNLQPFGRVIKGWGNNGEDDSEGINYKNLIGTYLHGPLLPKNPAIADFFIQAMAERRGISLENKLDDSIENFAHQQVKNKILGK